MSPKNQPGAKARIAPAGLLFLAITSVGWGFNWPITKFLLGYLPPMTLRGTTGLVGASLLAGLALLRGQSLRVPRALWGRLVLAAFLNVGCWMVLMGFALLFLPASEAALIAYTMPIWASILAWPILGERPSACVHAGRSGAGDAIVMVRPAVRAGLRIWNLRGLRNWTIRHSGGIRRPQPFSNVPVPI
jgi:EamA-like transporter family